MKHVLSVQDLSCLGKCSLTVALPVLSAMGCVCTPLPTAILSSHTAFPAPCVWDMTEQILPNYRHMQSTGVCFDAVTVGYLSDVSQAVAVSTLLDSSSGIKIVDPAMGDNGQLYAGLKNDHVNAMKTLCQKSNILLPNVTEAALLTDMPYQPQGDAAYYQALLSQLQKLGADSILLTGACADANKTGFFGWDKQQGYFSYETDLLPGQYHGTGDLFCAVFTGGIVLGKQIFDAAKLAADFVSQAIAATEKPSPFGVNFETCLPKLWETL